jgi:hypothetical protein
MISMQLYAKKLIAKNLINEKDVINVLKSHTKVVPQ